MSILPLARRCVNKRRRPRVLSHRSRSRLSLLPYCGFCLKPLRAGEDAQKIDKRTAVHTDCALAADAEFWAALDERGGGTV